MKLILGSRRCAEFLLVYVLSSGFAAIAQENAPEDGGETTTSEESLDKVEIVKEPNAEDEGLFGISKTELKLWQFQAFYDRINLSLELSGNSLGDKKLEYFTETEFVVGVGVRRGPYGLSFSRTMKNTNDSDKTSGRTSLASYRFDWKLDKHHIEAFHYSFEGFSIREPDKKILNAPFSKDVLAHSAGVFYTYLFEPEDVVLPGVLDRKKPTDGGTSFIFSSQISSFNIESKDPLIPEEYRVGSVAHADARKLARFRAYGGPGFGFFIPLN